MPTGFWMLWAIFLLICLAVPVGYGWGYRGWGVPYPRYIQQRRHARRVGTPDQPAIDHRAWGRAGDLIWLSLVGYAVWACLAFAWMR